MKVKQVLYILILHLGAFNTISTTDSSSTTNLSKTEPFSSSFQPETI